MDNLTEFFWLSFGIFLAFFGYSFGILLVFFCYSFGILLAFFCHFFCHSVSILYAFFWHSFGILLAFSWHSLGILLAFSWHSFHILLAFLWHSFGTIVEFFWNVFGSAICSSDKISTREFYLHSISFCCIWFLLVFSFSGQNFCLEQMATEFFKDSSQNLNQNSAHKKKASENLWLHCGWIRLSRTLPFKRGQALQWCQMKLKVKTLGINGTLNYKIIADRTFWSKKFKK